MKTMNNNIMFNLPNYYVRENLYQGTRTLVYRGQGNWDQKSVIIKVLRNPHPSFHELVQFRNQYIITRHLEHPTIVKPLALERYGNSYALIMPDSGAIALSDYWPKSEPSLSNFLNIAIQLTEALQYLTQQCVIHKDIKPSNILIHPQTKQVQLIDFSISTLLPREQQQLISPNILEGTLAYISPEQTGRMNRGIDYRSDFYSLGVTFFELLTGKLPFESSDPMELVHCHIAKTPTVLGNREQEVETREPQVGTREPQVGTREPQVGTREPQVGTREQEVGTREQEVGTFAFLFPTSLQSQPTPNPSQEGSVEIPQILIDIVLKLMAKNAEDRYQSALGLKHDLEKCRQQLETTGEIISFDLGDRDRSDRFMIPEKLYGREPEVQALLDAFDRVSNPPQPPFERGELPKENPETETRFLRVKTSSHLSHTPRLLLVAGFSGIGKTAVINEVHKPIVRQNGYFIKGKFDQFNRNIPFSAFVQAFRDLMKQLLSESDTELTTWKTEILNALGDNAQVIIEVVPELENIIGSQPPVPELSGNAAQNRFNLLFQKFIGVFTSVEHPLVIFLDDLQWADSASLNLMKVLMSGGETRYLLLLGAYRDNEVYPAHPLMLTLAELKEEQAVVSTITLPPLAINHINQLIADTLKCSQKLAQPLTELVYQKTKGNPFFTTQFLQGLHEDELIKFNLKLGYWECNLLEVRDAVITDDVVEFVAGRLQKLVVGTQEVLKLAACIGNQFNLKTLAVVCDKPEAEVAADIWGALQEGLIVPISENYKFFQGSGYESQTQTVAVSYRFLHDRVQQAAYSLIPEDRKQRTHLQIGRGLLSNIPKEEQAEYIFDFINHLNIGRSLIDDIREECQLAQLNFIAGKKAKVATAYSAAIEYLLIGLELLSEDSWNSEYKLTLELYNLVTEVAYLNGNFEQMQEFTEIILQNTQTLLDKVPVYEIKITACIVQSQQLEAIKIAGLILQELGVNFPEQPQPSDIQKGFDQVVENLKGKSIPDLIDLPIMSVPENVAAMKILMQTLPAAFQSYQVMVPLIAFEMVKLSLREGNTSISAYGYSIYGLLLSGSFGDIDTGSEFGKLALKVLSKFNAQELKAKILTVVNAHVAHWQAHIRETLSPALEGYSAGLETGDFEYVGYCAYIYLTHSFWLGKNLDILEKDQTVYIDSLRRVKQQVALNWCCIYQQTTLNLQGKSEHLHSLIGVAYNEEKMLPLHQQAQDLYTINHLFINKLLLSYLFNDYSQALNNAKIAEESLGGVTGLVVVSLFYFYDSLVRLAIYPEVSVSEQETILDRVQTNQEKMKIWKNHAPMNYLHKFNLVEAERYRVLNQKSEAIELYDRAIVGAKENEYLQEEALANELTAKFYLNWGKEKVAASYMQEAYYCYARWGAKAKTDDLEKRYPQLLQPIFQAGTQSPKLWDTLTNIAVPKLSSHSSKLLNHQSQTIINTTLDLATVLKSSQAISEVIQLNELLYQLSQIILENSGGDRCLIFIRDENHVWHLRAVATTDSTQLCTKLLTDNTNLPVQLIQYVKNTREVLVINNIDTDLPIIDNYLQQNQPQSILCLPMLNQGKLIGILYLQNQLTRDVFTPERILMLNFISNQAAISIKNAQLHQKSELSLQQVKKSENLLRQIIDTIPQYVFWKDRNSTFLGCNQKLAKMVNFSSPEALIGKNDYDIPCTKEEADFFRECDRRVMESNQPELHIIETQRQSDGTIRWLDTNKIPLCDENGAVYGMLGSYEDITERIQLEQEQKRLIAILEMTSDYVGIVDTQCRVLWMNAQFKKLRPELHSEGNSFKLTENHPQWANEIIFNEGIPIATRDGTWFGETAVIDSTGREILVSQVIIAHKSAEGVPEYFSTTMRDISQLKATETALREKSEALEKTLQELQKTQLQMVQSEKMSALGNLMSGIAHEINNPLGFIAGNVQIAQENLSDLLEHLALYEQNSSTEVLANHAKEIDLEYLRADFPNVLKSMNVGVEQMRNISSSLRIFSRKDQEHKVAFNIHDGIESTLLLLKHRTKADDKRPSIEIMKQYEEVPEINCFPGQLNQVFMNILANAIDAFDDANLGKTYAEIQEKPNQIKIRTSQLDENQIQIEIEDNGQGMKPETRDRIFEQGFTTKGVGKGTGLGMAIAYQIIVEKHSGEIICESVVGEGTTLAIILPM